MKFLKKAAIGLLVTIGCMLLLMATAIISNPRNAHALDRVINGGTYQLVVLGDPVNGGPLVNETPVNRSGTITTLNVSQQLMAANPSRQGFMVQNSGAAVLWINELGSAATTAQPSIQIAVGATYVSPPYAASPTAINIIGGTTGQAFTAREW